MPGAALLLVFNRPRHTEVALRALLANSPSRLYVSGDGPRPDRPDERGAVEEVWEIIQEAEIPCPLFAKRSESNLGCRRAVIAGIEWFFETETEGIIVEDDVVLDLGAVDLVHKMLNYVRNNPRIGSVSAFNGVPRHAITDPESSFRGSIYSSSQAWGTWKDRWSIKHSDFQNWREWLDPSELTRLGGARFGKYWTRFFDRQSRDFTDTWDYLWLASNWASRRHHLIANQNHSTNVGFDHQATFSSVIPSWYPTKSVSWSENMWITPISLAPDAKADTWQSANAVGISKRKKIKRIIARYFPSLHRRYRNLRDL